MASLAFGFFGFFGFFDKSQAGDLDFSAFSISDGRSPWGGLACAQP